MKKFFKHSLVALGALLFLFIITGCTKSFCNINDSAVLYGSYEAKNHETIIETAKNNNSVIPEDDYWTFIDSKVDEVYNQVINKQNTESYTYIPQSYIDSHLQYLEASNSNQDTSNLVNVPTIKYIIKFTGNDVNGNQALWANFDSWTEEYTSSNPLKAPTLNFMNSYKNQIQTGVGNTVTCLTPNSGYFGINRDTYVQGKTWGEAFSEYGFLEGLLVYPIGWLIYTFTTFFGTNGAGQILSIFLVTLIVRLIIVLLSIGSYSTQTKMAELQPKLQMLQAKYPNNQTDQYQKQQFAAEQMKLYKQNKVHPFRSILILIVQFPLFICVWGALQGSAILTTGQVFNLQLSTPMQTAMFAGTSETPFAIVLFVILACVQFIAYLLPNWMQSYRRSKIVGDKTVQVEQNNTTMTMMKWMPWIMWVVIVFMSLQLPAAMCVYWLVGAWISILQTIITEIVMAFKRGSKGKKNKKDKFTSYKKVDKKHMKIR